jgi:hypothetical protein
MAVRGIRVSADHWLSFMDRPWWTFCWIGHRGGACVVYAKEVPDGGN